MEINCLHFDTLNSTSTWSKENYKKFDLNKITLVTADEQTAGHGRYNRKWHSPAKKNIYATFIFCLEKIFSSIGNITQIAALSIVKTLQEKGFHPLLKWPNDVLIDKKKLAGILCETIEENNHLVVILGIGININMPQEFLQQINQPATSLLVESGYEFDKQEILSLLTKHFLQDLECYLKIGFFPFLETYKNFLMHQKGTQITINSQTGTFERIDQDGTLILTINGQEKKFLAGEIEFS